VSEATTHEDRRSVRPTVTGTVVSAKMRDTIVVREDHPTKHPLYKKYMVRSTKYHAHDAGNTAAEGDVVEIMQSRPVSKLKRWRLLRVVRRAHGAAVHADSDVEQAAEEQLEAAAAEPSVHGTQEGEAGGAQRADDTEGAEGAGSEQP